MDCFDNMRVFAKVVFHRCCGAVRHFCQNGQNELEEQLAALPAPRRREMIGSSTKPRRSKTQADAP